MKMLKRWLKDLFFRVNPGTLTDGASILSYHNIGSDKAFFTVSPAALDRQLSYLKSKGIKVVPLSDLLRKLKAGEDISAHACLTFNDGYASTYTEVLPLLKKYA